MATNFPTSLDSLTNPTASDKLNSVTVPHASQHATLNDAVEALEAKVGVDGSSVVTSHDYLIDKQSVVPYDDASARTTAVPSPVEGQMSYLKDTNSVEVYDGSAWAAVGGGGKILQVVSTAKTDTFSASLSGYGDTAVTGLSVAITPTSATSTILVLATVNGARGSSGPLAISLKRGASGIFLGDAASNRMLVTSYSYVNTDAEMANIGLSYVDSPATTSATTYSIDIHNTTVGTQSVYVNRSATDTDTASYARTSSSITVMEVSA